MANTATVETQKPSRRRKTIKAKNVHTLHPMEETRRDKFLRLGLSRTNRVLNSIRLISNLASPNYDWTEADIEAIRLSVNSALNHALARFDRTKKMELPPFKFERA